MPVRPDRHGLLVSTRAARVRRRRGVVRAGRGVYVPQATDLARAAAAVHGLHDAALGRQAAVWLLTGGRVRLPGRVDVVTPPGTRSRRSGAHREPLSDGDVVEVAGLRVTSPLRTALDVARLLPRREALVCLDALTNTGVLRLEDIEEALAALRRVPGVVRARRLLPEVEPRSESGQETVTRLVLVDGGLPRPAAQVKAAGSRRAFLGWADLAYRRLRLLIEYLGEAAHRDSGLDDAVRTRALEDEGYAVVPVVASDLRRPQLLLAEVQRRAARQYVALGVTGPLWVAEVDPATPSRPRGSVRVPRRRPVTAATPRPPRA